MAKWTIPRHEPRSAPKWAREHRNASRRARDARALREERADAAQARQLAEFALVARHGDVSRSSAAKAMISECARKKSLSLGAARKCAFVAAFETGRDFAVYLCPWCRGYHITSHPAEGREYAYVAKGFAPRGADGTDRTRKDGNGRPKGTRK